ncbi:NlpC/P60 family protein [Nonomuraea sp. NPDC005983]|uniref:C40 family peptidase n=1 Tax=Nonomuraea sp. NPDC005983 TaxID=3155595 RepID=UPI0033B259F1
MHSVGAAFLAAALVFATCPQVHADPVPSPRDVAKAREAVKERAKRLGAAGAKLAVAQSQLEELDSRVERLVEAYNGEQVQLERSQQAATEANTRLAAADAEVEKARQAVAVLAAESYGGLDLPEPALSLLVGVDGDSALQSASLLEHLGRERAQILEHMRDVQEVAAILRAQAADAYADHQAATERVRLAKLAAEAAVAEQKRETKDLKATRDELQREVEAARTRAERLARQRTIMRTRYSSALVGTGSTHGDLAANWALTQLGKPYVWAADGPSSYDCSGLTMRAWEQAGVTIDHWTGTQWTSGPHVPLDQLRRGDLLFFGYISDDPGTIHHVGMYVGNGMMVHAPQTGDVVRVAPIDRWDLVGATRPQ